MYELIRVRKLVFYLGKGGVRINRVRIVRVITVSATVRIDSKSNHLCGRFMLLPFRILISLCASGVISIVLN